MVQALLTDEQPGHSTAVPAQASLRHMKDMQALMEQPQAFENRVLERLNAGRSVRSFLIAAVELLAEAVNILVVQVFRKDDYAVKYAVEPLLLGDEGQLLGILNMDCYPELK